MTAIVHLTDDQVANAEALKHDPDHAWLWDAIQAGQIDERSFVTIELGDNDVAFGDGLLASLEGNTVDLHFANGDSATVNMIGWTRTEGGPASWEAIEYTVVDSGGEGDWSVRVTDIADINRITYH